MLAGYPFRRTFQAFVDSYWQLFPSCRMTNGGLRQAVEGIVQAAGISDFQIGKTKVNSSMCTQET